MSIWDDSMYEKWAGYVVTEGTYDLGQVTVSLATALRDLRDDLETRPDWSQERRDKVTHHMDELHSLVCVSSTKSWFGTSIVTAKLFCLICDTLDEYAPVGLRFGRHSENNPTCYGFWEK